jgi:hypothetical protein
MVLMVMKTRLNTSQLIIIRVIHSILMPEAISDKKVTAHAEKANRSLLPARMRLKRFIPVLFFSKAICCGR